MKKYNWQQSDWPHFQYDLSKIEDILYEIAIKTGLLQGKLTHLDKDLQFETVINLMVEEAIKTSQIEGEFISRPDLRSSIKNKFALNQKAVRVTDRRAVGLAELLYDARKTFSAPLTDTQLFNWHLLLFSSSMNPNLTIASWRTHEESMQIVSGYHGNWRVHYEAPPSKNVPGEMKKFLKWFNESAPGKKHEIKFAPVRAAIAHLYFESIHPFEDGNGRIGRTIAEKALSQGLGYPVMLSLSQAINLDKKTYYQALNIASKTNEITAWIQYFTKTILVAQTEVDKEIDFIFKKAKFFNHFEKQLNERELKVLKRMIDAGPEGFEGGMSAKKYMTIAKTSKATATRDLQHLLIIGAVTQTGSGRSVRYELKL